MSAVALLKATRTMNAMGVGQLVGLAIEVVTVRNLTTETQRHREERKREWTEYMERDRCRDSQSWFLRYSSLFVVFLCASVPLCLCG